MMDSILSILGVGASVASGGIFGILGAGVSAWFKSKEKKLEAESDREVRSHEARMFELQMQAASQAGAWDGLATSIKADIAATTAVNYKWVIAVKSLFRPFITLFLWLATSYEMHTILSGTFSEYIGASDTTLFSRTELIELSKYIVYSTVFSATTATTWWFGERALSMPDMKNR